MGRLEVLSSNSHLRGILQDTVRRLKVICQKSGRSSSDENDDMDPSKNVFQNLVMSFIRFSVRCKELISSHVNILSKDSEDTAELIESNHLIRQSIHRLKQLCEEMKSLVNHAEQDLLFKKSTSKKPEEFFQLTEKETRESKKQYLQCVETLQELRNLSMRQVTNSYAPMLENDIANEQEDNLVPRTQLEDFLDQEPLADFYGQFSSREVNDDISMVNDNWMDLDYPLDHEDSGNNPRGLFDDTRFSDEKGELAIQEKQIDEGLDRLKEGMHRLKEIAQNIQSKLTEDERVIETTGDLVESQMVTIRMLTNNVERIMKQTKPSQCVLYILIVIFVVVVIAYCLYFLNII